MDSRINFDGSRVNQGKKRAFTRNGLDWTKRFSAIAGAFRNRRARRLGLSLSSPDMTSDGLLRASSFKGLSKGTSKS
jgi:ATP-dependent DNA ligase